MAARRPLPGDHPPIPDADDLIEARKPEAQAARPDARPGVEMGAAPGSQGGSGRRRKPGPGAA